MCKRKKKNPLFVVNGIRDCRSYISQLGWAMVLDIQSNIILDASVTASLGESNIETSGFGIQQDYFLWCDGYHLVSRRCC